MTLYNTRFEKVSFEQFKKDFESVYGDIGFNLKSIYDKIKLPERATIGSAGYDFYSPTTMFLSYNDTKIFPTGIRAEIEAGYFLGLFPRSGLGFKGIRLLNTTGIIDSDYYYSDNEGHIMAKIRNESSEKQLIKIEQGQAFMQGIFIPYGITCDDNPTQIRNGGFGSTDR